MTALVAVHRDGNISWVSASAYEAGWTTAASSPSGVAVAFVDSFSFTSGQQAAVMYNRGVPVHQRITQQDAPTLSVNAKWLASAAFPNYPVHIEFRENKPDGSAFWQFYHCIPTTNDVSEAMDGNTQSLSFQSLGYLGATASGYLAH